MARLFCMLTIALAMPSVSIAQSLETSTAWYAAALRAIFPEGITIAGVQHSNDRIGAPTQDVTRFAVATRIAASAFLAEGTVELRALPTSVETLGNPRYMLRLQGYVLDANGRIVWSQNGFPQGDAWFPRGGGTRSFRLVNSVTRVPTGTLWLIAIGEPLGLSGVPELYVILGAQRVSLRP